MYTFLRARAFSDSRSPDFSRLFCGLTERYHWEERLQMKRAHDPTAMTNLEGRLVEKSQEVANLKDVFCGH